MTKLENIENSWIIQWRYTNEKEQLFWSKHEFRYFSTWRNLKHCLDKDAHWLYAAKNRKDASKHTLEEAFELYNMMKETWKGDHPSIYHGYHGSKRLWRIFNLISKEEIYPSTL